ncbi:Cyclin-dependent kinase C-3 [Hibiscus syriacus]|uniref:cyclin-dependent kinase n=1 Tax=Hibiscus syriacus TaxID=106335 RepID=A0A6A3B828_HIBSY|nr:Cyclin-dependent kinase C-3 [Hibiscus syriacus]
MAIAGAGQLNLHESPCWGSRSVDCFEKLEQISEGTYGQVYMAREIKTGEIVALKKIRMDNERGFPITAIREIKILKKLHHENVIKLKESVTSQGAKDEQGRPGKCCPIPINNLLLGATKYSPAVDMWSVGCIFAELLHGKLIFPGKDEPEQLNKIFELCGAPDEVNWPGVSKIPWYNNFKPTRPMKRRLREALGNQEKAPATATTRRKGQTTEITAFTASCRLPPIQSGQAHAQMRPGPNPPLHGSQPPVAAGPGHHHGKPRGPAGGPGRYPANGTNGGFNHQNHGGGYSSGPYPPQGRGAPYGSSGMPGAGPRGSGGSGYGVGAPNYSQDGPTEVLVLDVALT